MNTTNRDKGTGRYVHTAAALCSCGHSLGVHTAERKHGSQPCIAGDFGDDCECETFRKARK